MSEQNFWQVFGNGQKAGKKGYLHLRTYKSVGAALNYARRGGVPVWIVESRREFVQGRAVEGGLEYGGFDALRWNSGAGLVGDFMPVLPLVG